MALAMARPWKHPKTGVYWLRKRVPDDLRAGIGKREEKLTLKTRDPAEAKRLHAAALAALEQRWANLRAPARKLENSDLHRIAATTCERWRKPEARRASSGIQRLPIIFGMTLSISARVGPKRQSRD